MTIFFRLSARQRSLSTTSVAKGYSPRYQYVGYFPNHNSSECEYAHMLQVHGRNTPQIDVIGYTPDTADSSPTRKDRDIYQTSPMRKGRTLCEPNCGKIESIYVTSQCPLESTHLPSRGTRRYIGTPIEQTCFELESDQHIPLGEQQLVPRNPNLTV